MKAPFYIPYVFVRGSLNNSICGGQKVKIKNNTPIKLKIIIDSLDEIIHFLFFLNRYVSNKKVKAVATKNIVIFTQSGVLPNIPFSVQNITGIDMSPTVVPISFIHQQFLLFCPKTKYSIILNTKRGKYSSFICSQVDSFTPENIATILLSPVHLYRK